MSLRVVLLKKTALLDKERFAEPIDLRGVTLRPWVAMGHFDAMYSYQLDAKNRNIFAMIHENNSDITAMNDEDTYFHPLYLLTDQDDTDFWQQDTWFMAVTRIHLVSTVTAADEIEQLRQYILKQCEVSQCRCLIYETIELSDLTMVVKSDHMSKMLNVILNLWSHPGIGKLYTYCGVDYGHLKNLEEQPAADDIIDFVSMRFAVRTPNTADAFFQVVKNELRADPIYSIAGVDDAVLNFTSLPAQKLVGLFRRWFVTGLPEGFHIKQIFSDITTRLGTNYRKYTPNEGDSQPPNSEKGKSALPPKHSLDQLCEELVTSSEEVQKLAEGKLDSPVDKYWLRCFSELSYSLLRLSRTAPLDEFVYLMLPGLKAFLCNIKDILRDDSQKCFDDLDKEGLCQFVDNWFHLMEHVMRLEGQLAHHPETRPILYDIPLAMLEHTLALLDLCSQILQKKDTPKKDIQFILFPKLCTSMKTEEIFAANYQLPGLLSIPIPLHMMYDPQTIQITLCHEISHFVGERHRNRNLRRDCYIHAASILIADLIFETENETFIEVICQKLREYIFGFSMDLNTIDDVEAVVQQWIDELLYDDTSAKYCDLIRDVLKNAASTTEYKQLQFSADFINLQERNKNYFAVILPKLTMLFREVFADICMVCLLNLEADTYLGALYGGVVERPDSIEFTAVRIFTTLSAVGKDIPEQAGSSGDEVCEKFASSIGRLIVNRLDRDTDPENYQFPIGCVRQLKKYSDKCAADLKALLEGDDEMEEMVDRLQRMYCNVMSTNMDYTLLREFINDYRKKCLGDNS